MSCDDVKTRPAAAIHIDIATCTDHSVAMHWPRAAILALARCWKAIDETRLWRIRVGIRKQREVQSFRRSSEFGRKGGLRLHRFAFVVRIAPLHDVVVL